MYNKEMEFNERIVIVGERFASGFYIPYIQNEDQGRILVFTQ